MYLGHNGTKCPSHIGVSATVSDDSAEDDEEAEISDPTEDKEEAEIGDSTEHNEEAEIGGPPEMGKEAENPFPRPGSLDKDGNKIMLIIDKSGLHPIGVCPCTCSGASSIDIQLLTAGIYPATPNMPKTGFTFSALDDFLMENRECTVTALSYYSKLRRMTNNMFPQLLPVRGRTS